MLFRFILTLSHRFLTHFFPLVNGSIPCLL